MRAARSLSNRIFIACTILATLSLGFTFAYVNARATADADATLSRGVHDAAELAEQHFANTITDTFSRLARLVADLSNLKAAADTGDPPTMQPLVEGFRSQINADVLLVLRPDGTVLGQSGAPALHPRELGIPFRSTAEDIRFVAHARGLLQVISVPIQVLNPPELLGQLVVGVFLDHDRALQFKRVTNSEIAFGINGRILASSLPDSQHASLAAALSSVTPSTVLLGADEYLALARAVHVPAGEASGRAHPEILVLRSKSEGLGFLRTLQAGLAGALVVALVLATVASYAVARTITRPLAAVTGAMAHVAATGDVSRRVPLHSSRWDDGDARLLASAFNTLTVSIERFQREETQRDRLSSLGRLSTVIAHEIRNPLMIIRASLRSLRRDNLSPPELQEAVADIDEETARLNRIVSEVLDFARPMRFDLAEADVNDVCRASAAAAGADDAEVALRLELDPSLPPIVTDAERLRTAFVNILTNALHAVRDAEGEPADGLRRTMPAAGVRVRTALERHRIVVTIADGGTGISADDMAHIFDPYFTTRRTGTGLGLPIARNIIEGLGGTLSVSSVPGSGTEIQIGLPTRRPDTTA